MKYISLIVLLMLPPLIVEGAVVERLSYDYPKLTAVVGGASDFVLGYRIPMTTIPTNAMGALGGGLSVVNEYGSPIADLFDEQNVSRVNEK